MTTPDDMTLVIPLRAKEGMPLPDFYEYWLNAHVTMPARFPGIDSIWLHVVSFDRRVWPRLPGVSHRPDPEDEFHGVPEATFPTMADLELFQASSRLQMEDGINFLGEMIAYCSLGAHTATIVDKLDGAPDGHDGLLRHLLFLRQRPGVTVGDLRGFVTDTLVPAWAQAPEVLKLRRHLFEPVEITLDHPGVVMSKPLERQYQAAIEVVVAASGALAAFAASPAWTGTADALAEHCAAVHAARVERCITTKYRATPTLAGVRGVAVADVIRRVGAKSQLAPEVSALFQPVPLRVKEFNMSRDVAPIFADIDAMDADKFVAHLTPDVRFRFANADPALGRAAVKEGVEGFWTTIDGLTHHIRKIYEVGDTVIAQIDVEYRRKDGKSVTVPNCDVLQFQGDLVRDWQIYIDLAPVYA